MKEELNASLYNVLKLEKPIEYWSLNQMINTRLIQSLNQEMQYLMKLNLYQFLDQKILFQVIQEFYFTTNDLSR